MCKCLLNSSFVIAVLGIMTDIYQTVSELSYKCLHGKLVSYKNISGNKLRRNVQKNVALKTQTLSVVLKQLALFGFEGQRPFRVDNFNR